MKKLIPSLFLLLFLVDATRAQNSFSVTSDTINLSGPNNVLMTGHARVTNIGMGTLFVKVKRTVVDTAAGHSAYFCWTGTCYQIGRAHV